VLRSVHRGDVVSTDGLGGLGPELVVLLVPLIALQLGLMVLAIIDLLRDDRRVRGGNKGVWAVVIVFVSMVGPILYFLVGRDEEPVEPGAPGPGAMAGWVAPTRTAASDAGPATTPEAPPGIPEHPAVPAPARTAPSPVPGAPAAIAVEGLTKRYPGGVLALDGLSMTVPEGSVFGLLGPNGAGKTTTLRLLAGLTRATAGTATVDAIPVSADGLGVRRRLGYLEQDPRAYGWMTGREQVRLLGRLHGLTGTGLDRAVSDALARVDLSDAADRRAGSYSGGMRQRLGIAGALVHRPPVVILDEPVSSLDPGGRRDILGLIADLRGATTVLFSTHVLADVERICDRVGILSHGRLIVEGPLGDLLDRYAQPVYRVEPEPGQAAALQALADRLRELDWVTGVGLEHGLLTVAVADPTRAGRELLTHIADADVAVVSVARARPTLEDVFLRLTGSPGGAAA